MLRLKFVRIGAFRSSVISHAEIHILLADGSCEPFSGQLTMRGFAIGRRFFGSVKMEPRHDQDGDA